jgi:hypothetical protein
MMDILISSIFWATGNYFFRDTTDHQNMLTSFNARTAICLASYGVVYLSHVIA